MALIKCSECGKEVSSKASKCVNCGNTIENNDNINISLDKSKVSYFTSLAATICFSIYTCYSVYTMIDNNFIGAMQIFMNLLYNLAFIALSISLMYFFKKK